MADKPPKELKDESGAEERFAQGLKNALATPRKPHNEKRESGKPNPRPASASEED